MDKRKLFIIIALIIAFSLRFYKLGDIPKSLHKDEMVNVYVGRFVLDNGVDLYGNRFPLFYFDKFGDFPPVVPMYLQALGTYLFGLNQFGARFTTALLSLLMIIPIFYITEAIYNDKRTAFFAALGVAVMPWQIVFGRTSAEGIVAFFFYFLGIFLIIKTSQTKRISYTLVSIPLFLLTYLIYPGFRIIVPLTLLPFPLFFWQKKKDKIFKFASLIFIFFVLTTLIVAWTKWGQGRFFQTSIFHIVSGVDIQNQQLSANEKYHSLARIFHNKPIGYTREFLAQYFSYFSGTFLFMKGGGEITHQVPGNGQIYLIFLPLLFVPFIKFLRSEKATNINWSIFHFMIYLMAISPIPGALTVIAVPNPHRAITAGVFFIIIASYGFHHLLFTKFKRNLMIGLVFFIMALETIFFVHDYFSHVDYIQFIGNNERAQDMVDYVLSKKDQYKSIYLPSKDYLVIYYLFFKKDFGKDMAGKFGKNFVLDRRENIYFFETDCPSDQLFKEWKTLTHKVLVVERERCQVPQNVVLKPLVQFPTTFGSIAFKISESQPPGSN